MTGRGTVWQQADGFGIAAVPLRARPLAARVRRWFAALLRRAAATALPAPVGGSLAWPAEAVSPAGRAPAAGRPAAAERFQALVLPHLDAAHNLARFLARDADAAEDIVQDAFLRAFRSFDDFRGGSPRAWILAIVRNCHHTWRAARRRDPGPWPEGAAGPAGDEIDGETPAEIASREDTPEAALLRRSEAEAVRAVLETLPEPFREVLVLRDLEDLSYREIAEVADLPIGTVMSRLARARTLFAARWRGAGPEDAA